MIFLYILFIEPQQVFDMKSSRRQDMGQFGKGGIKRPCVWENVVRKAVEEPFLYKGRRKLHIRFGFTPCFFVNDAVHIEKIDARIVILKGNLFVGLEKFNQKVAMRLLIGFADEVNDVGVGQAVAG